MRESVDHSSTSAMQSSGFKKLEIKSEELRNPRKERQKVREERDKYKREDTYLVAEVDSALGRSLDETYMNRRKDWSTEEEAASWSSVGLDPETEKKKALVSKEGRLYSSNKKYSYNYIHKVSDKKRSNSIDYISDSISVDEKVVSSRDDTRYRMQKRGIKIIDDRQLMPPAISLSVGRDRDKQVDSIKAMVEWKEIR